jgi:hypothetical protein
MRGFSAIENGPWLWQSNSFYTNYSGFFQFCDAVEVSHLSIIDWNQANLNRASKLELPLLLTQMESVSRKLLRVTRTGSTLLSFQVIVKAMDIQMREN